MVQIEAFKAVVRKVYITLAWAFILAATRPESTTPGFPVEVITLIALFPPLFMLHPYSRQHTVNLVLMMVFTVMIAVAVWFSPWSFPEADGGVDKLTVLLAQVMLVLTRFTHFAVARGHDFSFLEPFLMFSLAMLIVLASVQIFSPLGKLGSTIFPWLTSCMCFKFIIYETENLIKRRYN